ncbi:MAG: type I methionyl aminopeptidase [Spirochaetales bacterium]|nr:type I methionyl aminopeptidase [Spirochaetales bacterium]
MLKLKNARQVEGIARSCQLLSELYAALRPRIVPGVSTGELDDFAREFIVKAGGKPAFLGYMDYPATLCVSVNEEVIHGIPGKRRLAEGDLAGIDCGIELDGYFSDAAFSVAVGTVAPEVRRLMEVTKECLELAIAQVKPGNRVHHIGKAVYAHAVAAGFGVVRQYCGHGVGFSQHEDPQVPNYVSPGPNPRLVPGMVLAIEPMINLGTGDVTVLEDDWTVVTLDGRPSAHFEHTVVVTQDGCRVLTDW